MLQMGPEARERNTINFHRQFLCLASDVDRGTLVARPIHDWLKFADVVLSDIT